MGINKNVLIDELNRAWYSCKGDGFQVSAGLPEPDVLGVVLGLAVLLKIVPPCHVHEQV